MRAISPSIVRNRKDSDVIAARVRCRLLLVAIVMAPAVEARTCELSSSDRQWIGSAIGIWSRAAEVLQRGIETMPWTILYDEQCIVHLNPRRGKAGVDASLAVTFGGKAVPVRAVAYRKGFSVPSGDRLTSDAVAFTSIAKSGGTFFVMALPSVWRKDPRSMPDVDIESFASGVLAHEMTHTIHLESVMKALEGVKLRLPSMPESVNDDHLQEVFAADSGYVADYDREIALYVRAVAERDDTAARSLAREAIAASDQRRARHFQGDLAYFNEVEPLFLNMEGVASWVAYTVTGAGADPMTFSGRFWSQQQGLLLFLLLDRFDPAWKSRVFAEPAPDPFALLRDVL
jgi:hypothetical protein